LIRRCTPSGSSASSRTLWSTLKPECLQERIVGDNKLPEAQRRTRTNITGTGTPRVAWSDLPLRDAGLFGPVRLLSSADE